MRIETEIISNVTSLDFWKDDWEALFAQGEQEPSVSYEWTSALLRNHIRPGDRVYLLIFSMDNRKIGFLPLIASQSRFLGQNLISLSPLSERYDTHTDILFHGEFQDCLAALLQTLRSTAIRWDIFRMGRLLEHQPLLENLETQLQSNKYLRRIQYEPPSFYLTLPESMNSYLARRSGKFRNYLRRAEKKIGALGVVHFDVIANQVNLEFAYEQMLTIERNSWKHEHGTAISAISHQTAFYHALCLGAAAVARLHLSFLYLDDQPVAYNLGYLHNRRYYYLKTSYDEKYRAVGVATFARARLIETLIGQGVQSLDFPGEPYEWEQQWTEELRWHKSIALFNSNFPARIFYVLSKLRRALKKQPEGKVLEFCDARALQPPKDQKKAN